MPSSSSDNTSSLRPRTAVLRARGHLAAAILTDRPRRLTSTSDWSQLAFVAVIAACCVARCNAACMIQPDGNGAVVIPDGTTSIPNGAFRECTGLASVTIPDSVTSIGDRAFMHCSSLASVTIPDSVTSLGDRAFDGCSSLASVTIPDSVTSIADYAFRRCTSLVSVTIPGSVTSLGNFAFRECTGLASVTIPDSVTSIGDRAFDGCSSLASVTIPDSVTSLGDEAFRGCPCGESAYIAGATLFDCRAPTANPSPAPTTRPPTNPPTNQPTHPPTNPPTTLLPTNPPTRPPTSRPTRPPTTRPPTNPPTRPPTSIGPTPSPTPSPTLAPTFSEPTPAPTAFPTTTDGTGATTDDPTPSDHSAAHIVVAVLGCVVLLAIVAGFVVAWRRRRRQQGEASSTKDAEAPNPVGNGRAVLPASSDDMYEVIPACALNKATLSDAPSSAAPAIPPARPSDHNPVDAPPSGDCAVAHERELGMPPRQRSASYETALDKLELGDCPEPGPAAVAWSEKISDGLPTGRRTVEPDSTGVPDPNDVCIHTLPATAVHPPDRPTAESAVDAAHTDYELPTLQSQVDSAHADYELPSLESKVDFAHADHEVPAAENEVISAHADYGVSMDGMVANPPPPMGGLEDQYAAVDYTGVATPVDEAMYAVIPAQTFAKDTLQRKMQLGVDGNLRLASVRRTNPLATNATPATGSEPVPPTIHEYEYSELSDGGADAIYDEPAGCGQPTASDGAISTDDGPISAGLS